MYFPKFLWSNHNISIWSDLVVGKCDRLITIEKQEGIDNKIALLGNLQLVACSWNKGAILPVSIILLIVLLFFLWPGPWGGAFQLENGQNRSHIALSLKIESHQRSHPQIATHMMVLYRTWANNLGSKRPNWNNVFVRVFCKVIAGKGLKTLTIIKLKDPLTTTRL